MKAIKLIVFLFFYMAFIINIGSLIFSVNRILHKLLKSDHQ